MSALETTNTPYRVVIADDHPTVRQSLATFLKLFPQLRLVGEAQDGLEAVELCHNHQPDLVILDLIMPALDGIEATRRILAENATIKIIVLTNTIENQELSRKVFAAGAARLINKAISIDELEAAIIGSLEGKTSYQSRAFA